MNTVDKDVLLEKVIRQNFADIRARIAAAAERAGRSAEDTKIVVVTKAQPVEVIRSAVNAGATLLGENYPEETVRKLAELGNVPGVQWHMIGHLQSRKVPQVAESFAVFHSLDSARLAEKLSRRLMEIGRVMQVLLEMNVGGEESKFGWQASDPAQWGDLLPEIEMILQQPGLQLRGLMTMPPFEEDPSRARPYFERLRHLREFFSTRFGTEFFSELSMGTSVDFEIAVEEGATFVRIGQAILGPRPAKRV